jgi:hypothetical protein
MPDRNPERIARVGRCGLLGCRDGPVADALSKRRADLTQLGETCEIPLPEEPLASFIDGRRDLLASGARLDAPGREAA